MNTQEKLKAEVAGKIELAQRDLQIVESLPELALLNVRATVYGANQIDFDRLTHDQIIEVIKAIGGKWNKTPVEDGRVDYTYTRADGFIFRCWHGEPPPNCKNHRGA